MSHKIQLGEPQHTVPYSTIQRGTIFQLPGRVSDSNLYMKVGSRAYSLKTGEEYTNEPDREVVPIENCTTITITVNQ